jgi:hypothetical protein
MRERSRFRAGTFSPSTATGSVLEIRPGRKNPASPLHADLADLRPQESEIAPRLYGRLGQTWSTGMIRYWDVPP